MIKFTGIMKSNPLSRAYVPEYTVWVVKRDHITDLIAGCLEDVDFADSMHFKVEWLGCYQKHIPVGCIGIMKRGHINPKVGVIKGWYVARQHRDIGIGGLLLLAVEKYALSQGIERLICCAPTDKVLRKAKGWQETGKVIPTPARGEEKKEWVKYIGDENV